MATLIVLRHVRSEGELATLMFKRLESSVVPVVGNEIDDTAWHQPVRIARVVCDLEGDTYKAELEDWVLPTEEEKPRRLDMMRANGWSSE
ncbi:hypothetical protein [Burkholderia gladioli]|uniref:hypothetical protein n=1 Tax=Burkholderia gladioli TaxID=28095 RepID=UPI001129CCA2|nr:hypothetical protein [Burkholderia gladioli]MDN7754762.1 hypothetical protein [Burkholderia gladioli]TPQ46720.1 hypothetical protein C2U71_07190 [Burkholderia ubonensis]